MSYRLTAAPAMQAPTKDLKNIFKFGSTFFVFAFLYCSYLRIFCFYNPESDLNCAKSQRFRALSDLGLEYNQENWMLPRQIFNSLRESVIISEFLYRLNQSIN